MAIRKSASSGIPYGNNSGRPASPTTGQPYFNGEAGRLELYTSTGWNNIVQETPGVSGATGHYYESDGEGIFTVSGTNFVDGAIAYAVGNNGVEYQAESTTYNSLVQLSVVFSNLSKAYEPYDIKITNPSNLFGLLPDAFTINDSPIWVTSAGSLGTFNSGSVSYQLESTDDESNTVTYSLVSGSLPTGLTLSSSGLISGTNTAAPATYSFTISISDGSNASISRSFSMNVPYPTVTGGTLASDSTYYYRVFTGNGTFSLSGTTLSADVLTIAGGGGGGSGDGGGGSGGGGAGGVYYSSASNLSTGSYTVLVGAGGAGGTYPNAPDSSQPGSNSRFGTMTPSVGGGYGNGSYQNGQFPGGNGGSGGGGSGSSAYIGGVGGSATSGQGNVGGDGGNTSPSGGAGYKGGGGGGAGFRGQHHYEASSGVNTAGGNGTISYASWLSAISSVMTGISDWSTATSGGYIAGGGAGAGIWSGWTNALSSGAGGAGGGGAGGTTGGNNNQVATTGTSAVQNTGSGGGASAYTAAGSAGSGASGIVVVRYTKSSVGG